MVYIVKSPQNVIVIFEDLSNFAPDPSLAGVRSSHGRVGLNKTKEKEEEEDEGEEERPYDKRKGKRTKQPRKEKRRTTD